jgi:hypothetical protein
VSEGAFLDCWLISFCHPPISDIPPSFADRLFVAVASLYRTQTRVGQGLPLHSLETSLRPCERSQLRELSRDRIDGHGLAKHEPLCLGFLSQFVSCFSYLFPAGWRLISAWFSWPSCAPAHHSLLLTKRGLSAAKILAGNVWTMDARGTFAADPALGALAQSLRKRERPCLATAGSATKVCSLKSLSNARVICFCVSACQRTLLPCGQHRVFRS